MANVLQEEKRNQIIEKFSASGSIKGTAKELKVSRNTVKAFLKAEGILPFVRPNPNQQIAQGQVVGKLIQRNAYGFRNFENYRRRLIYKTI